MLSLSTSRFETAVVGLDCTHSRSVVLLSLTWFTMLFNPDFRRLLIILCFFMWLPLLRSSQLSSSDSRLALARISGRMGGTGGAERRSGVASEAKNPDPTLVFDIRLS